MCKRPRDRRQRRGGRLVYAQRSAGRHAGIRRPHRQAACGDSIRSRQPGEFGNETWEDGSWQRTRATPTCGRRSRSTSARGLLYLPVGTPSNDYYGGASQGRQPVRRVARVPRREHRPTRVALSRPCITVCGITTWVPAHTADGAGQRQKIDVVAAPSKNGFLYVFDRVTGKPVWPIEERQVPPSDMPGERASRTQPFPTQAAAVCETGLHRRRRDRFHARVESRCAEDHRTIPARPALHAAVAPGHDQHARRQRRRQLGRRRRGSGNGNRVRQGVELAEPPGDGQIRSGAHRRRLRHRPQPARPVNAWRTADQQTALRHTHGHRPEQGRTRVAGAAWRHAGAALASRA